MQEPLSQFADRLIRNNEVSTFIVGLVNEKGFDINDLERIIFNLKHSMADQKQSHLSGLGIW